jgi:hypothetical protein
VKGIRTIVRKEGTDSWGFFQSILVKGKIMNEPTKTKAIELAMEGITESNGEKNMKGKKSNPAVIAVLPVLPPSSIPTADSMKAVPELLPTKPAKRVETESVRRDFRMFLGLPSGSLRPEASASPTKVEIPSNRIVNVNTKITGT